MSFLITLSPAKRLDFETPAPDFPATQPKFENQARTLIQTARLWSVEDIAARMKLSPDLASLNHARYHAFKLRGKTGGTRRPALYAFQGDVYQGLDAASLTTEQVLEAQGAIRILSGLYGLLRPLDAIQPYRLEMGTRVETDAGHSLYAFWGNTIARALNAEAKASGATALLNLASQEYFKAVDLKALKLPLLTCHFKEMRNGKPTIVSFNAKRARGLMARYLITTGAQSNDHIREFNAEGYAFAPELSDETNLTFLKEG